MPITDEELAQAEQQMQGIAGAKRISRASV